MTFRVDFKSIEAPYMREEETRLLSWGSFLLLLLVLDLCYALGEAGVTTITDGRKISEGVCPPYMREEECRLLLWGRFPFVPMCYTFWFNALGDKGSSDHHQRSNIYTM